MDVSLFKIRGAVAAGDSQTVEAGAEMLRRGGNAVDAAVAAAFASFVAEMVLVNIGGGGVAQLYLADSGQAITLDFFSDMSSGRFEPERADFRQILVDFGAAQQPFYIGRASVAVPGVVAGLCRLAEDYGTMSLTALLKPAIRLARQGTVLSESLAYVARLLADIFTDTARSAAVYAPRGLIPRAGERLKNPQLGQTLQTLGKRGASYFYRGDLAAQIIRDQVNYGGLLTQDDLARYRPISQPPLQISYRDHTILLPSLSSIGGVLIAFSLKLLAGVKKMPQPFDRKHIQLLAEVMRLTNIARRDVEVDGMPPATFLSEAHLATYRRRLDEALQGVRPMPEPDLRKGPNDTTHISVLDGQGNLASITTSAGEGAGFMVGETGVALNNMLGEIDLHPNGFHQTPPGSRLQTMMSPTLVLKQGRPLLALGSGGSTRLRSAILQVLSNVIDFDMPLAEAVSAPRVHFEDGLLQVEGGVETTIAVALESAGYRVNRWPAKNMYFGGVHAVGWMGEDPIAVGDRRRGGQGLIV